ALVLGRDALDEVVQLEHGLGAASQARVDEPEPAVGIGAIGSEIADALEELSRADQLARVVEHLARFEQPLRFELVILRLGPRARFDSRNDAASHGEADDHSPRSDQTASILSYRGGGTALGETPEVY